MTIGEGSPVHWLAANLKALLSALFSTMVHYCACISADIAPSTCQSTSFSTHWHLFTRSGSCLNLKGEVYYFLAELPLNTVNHPSAEGHYLVNQQNHVTCKQQKRHDDIFDLAVPLATQMPPDVCWGAPLPGPTVEKGPSFPNLGESDTALKSHFHLGCLAPLQRQFDLADLNRGCCPWTEVPGSPRQTKPLAR